MPEKPRRPSASRRGTTAGGGAARPRPTARLTGGAAKQGASSARAPIRGPVKIIFLDVDGTLTDGVIGFDRNGDSRNFSIRDGLALMWAKDLGVLPVVISGRASSAVDGRMQDLGLEHYQGIQNKVAVAERVLEREGAEWRDCVMVGDDLPDVAIMKRVGWPVAVGDAQPEVKRVARTVLRALGGRGAVRELVEQVLKHNGTWRRVLERYEAS